MNVLAVFRSRTQTLSFAAELKRLGVSSQTVSTPRQAKVGCGLSCKFSYSSLTKARIALGRGKYSSFVGFFREVTYSMGKEYLIL